MAELFQLTNFARSQIKPGMQIVRISDLTKRNFMTLDGTILSFALNWIKDKSHYPRDIERGFVTSITSTTVFCRYWNYDGTLRTKSCSEGINIEYLYLIDGTSYAFQQEKIDAALKEYC